MMNHKLHDEDSCGGRIATPHSHDILCGRGRGLRSHKGNVLFRNWVKEHKTTYILSESNAEKSEIVKLIFSKVHDQRPPGRFLCRKEGWSPPKGKDGILDGEWILAGYDKAVEKTTQALREGANAVRKKHNVPMRGNCKELSNQASSIILAMKENQSNPADRLEPEPSWSSLLPSGYHPSPTPPIEMRQDSPKAGILPNMSPQENNVTHQPQMQLDQQVHHKIQQPLQPQDPAQVIAINFTGAPPNMNVNVSMSHAAPQDFASSVTQQKAPESSVNASDEGTGYIEEKEEISRPLALQIKLAVDKISGQSPPEQLLETEKNPEAPNNCTELLKSQLQTQQRLIDLQASLLRNIQSRGNFAPDKPSTSEVGQLEMDTGDHDDGNLLCAPDASNITPLGKRHIPTDDEIDDMASLASLLSDDDALENVANSSELEPAPIRQPCAKPTVVENDDQQDLMTPLNISQPLQGDSDSNRHTVSAKSSMLEDTNFVSTDDESFAAEEDESFAAEEDESFAAEEDIKGLFSSDTVDKLLSTPTSSPQLQQHLQTEKEGVAREPPMPWLYSWAPPLDETIQNQLEYGLPVVLIFWSVFLGYTKQGIALWAFVSVAHTFETMYTNFGPQTKSYHLRSAFITPEMHMWIDFGWLTMLATSQVVWPQHFGGLVDPMYPYYSSSFLLVLLVPYMILSYSTVYHKVETSRQKDKMPIAQNVVSSQAKKIN